ncbi:MAG: NADH-quinone oxidoreductase subunit NuoK [Thaumarchaeota archaeon]|nr:NADH-quinone oxidoreductase subunit NuoK [Nitrososphaerota archaeon]
MSGVLFSIGVYGLVSKRNAVRLLFAVEIVINAANLNFIAFWRYLGEPSAVGQTFVLFTIALAAAEAAVGLSIIISAFRVHQEVDVQELKNLKS